MVYKLCPNQFYIIAWTPYHCTTLKDTLKKTIEASHLSIMLPRSVYVLQSMLRMDGGTSMPRHILSPSKRAMTGVTNKRFLQRWCHHILRKPTMTNRFPLLSLWIPEKIYMCTHTHTKSSWSPVRVWSVGMIFRLPHYRRSIQLSSLYYWYMQTLVVDT